VEDRVLKEDCTMEKDPKGINISITSIEAALLRSPIALGHTNRLGLRKEKPHHTVWARI
jgi:hypothetical protein